MRNTSAARFWVSAALPAVLCSACDLAAQRPGNEQRRFRIGVQERQFTVDDAPRFLIFISYFGAMGAKDVAADLDFLKESGFDGVRIWPNSPEGPQLMREDGSLDPTQLARLLDILELARERGVVVDVPFTAENTPGAQ